MNAVRTVALAYLPPTAHAEPASDPVAWSDHGGLLASIRADVAGRLARACAHLPRADFDVLVDRIARFTHRWAEPATGEWMPAGGRHPGAR